MCIRRQDYRVAPVVSTIDDLLTRIPDRGAIDGPILQEILATAMLLADPDKTRRHGEGLLSGLGRVVDDDLPENAVAPSSLTAECDNGMDAVDQSEAVEVNNPVNPLITGLFDGIFEDDEQSESESEPELDSEPVTTEDDNEEPSDPDFWF